MSIGNRDRRRQNQLLPLGLGVNNRFYQMTGEYVFNSRCSHLRYLFSFLVVFNKADKIFWNNSEIYVMKGFILQARMNIEPITRGFQYNKKCLEMFERAKKLDPENPRSYLWHGVNLYNTPIFMGGGKDRALPLLEKAIKKFETFHLQSTIHPDWSKEYAQMMLIKCKE